jgi:molybdopterin converting factor small subunit
VVQRDDLGLQAGRDELLLSAAGLTINVRLHAGLQGIVGSRDLTLSLPAGATVDDLRRRLAGEHPMLEALLPTLAVAVGEEMMPPEHVLRDGDSVDVVPPIAGG